VQAKTVLSSFKPTLNLPSAFTPPSNGATFEGFSRQNKPFFFLPIIPFEIIPRYTDRKLQAHKTDLLSTLVQASYAAPIEKKAVTPYSDNGMVFQLAYTM
jgi:hypothetical protein